MDVINRAFSNHQKGPFLPMSKISYWRDYLWTYFSLQGEFLGNLIVSKGIAGILIFDRYCQIALSDCGNLQSHQKCKKKKAVSPRPHYQSDIANISDLCQYVRWKIISSCSLNLHFSYYGLGEQPFVYLHCYSYFLSSKNCSYPLPIFLLGYSYFAYWFVDAFHILGKLSFCFIVNCKSFPQVIFWLCFFVLFHTEI